MRRMAALLVFASVALGTSTPLDACSCIISGPPCQSAWEADAVFVARVKDSAAVTRTTPVADEHGVFTAAVFLSSRIRVEVLESFRGAPVGEATILTGSGGGDCGYGFATGETYLVYAWRHASGAWTTSICSRTRRLDRAADDLAYLRNIARQPSALGTIQGTVRQGNPGYPDRQRQREPVPVAGARVVATSAERVYEAVTGPDGTYTIAALPDSYDVAVEPPHGWWTAGPFRPTVLRDARGCVAADVLLQSDGRIAGRVVDPSGTPIAGLLIEAQSWESASRGLRSSQAHAVTGSDGAFELMRLPPQAYALSAAGHFHPGTRTLDRAAPVELVPTQRLAVSDFVLPVATTGVDGIVRDADGRPVEGAAVFIIATTSGRAIVGRSGPTAADGAFRMTVPPGPAYELVAEHGDATDRRTIRTAPFDLATSVSGLEVRLPETPDRSR